MASSSAPNAEYGFGIEEEYFLADLNSFEAPAETPEALFQELEEKTGEKTTRESLQAQLEVATAPSASVATVRDDLRQLRMTAAEAARKHGLAILASGTHPLARWREVSPSSSEHYFKVMDMLGLIGRRNMLCGMHVHVELPDPRRRVDVMTRLIPYLPLFVALSASSPFWQASKTGLMAYRPAAYDELPRSGIPELFGSEEEYHRYVSALTGAGAIEDASFIWWMVRPSLKYPTLELRAPDVCTRIGDALAIACLYRALARHLFRMPERNAGLTAVDRAIAVENKWIAQRYGVHGTFAGRLGPQTVAELLEEIIAMTAEDAAALGCSNEIERCRLIITGGASAESQLSILREREHEGSEVALRAVAQWIASETLAC
jgi:glutamate---cysteine ligase / carboxylate-amine ligase